MSNGVKFIRQNGGLARLLSGSDHISALLVYGALAAVPAMLALSPEDLSSAGITETTNPVLVYHAQEFFRVNPGAKLYLQGVTASDGTYSEVKTLQSFAGGDIRQIGICDYKTAASNIAARVANLNHWDIVKGDQTIKIDDDYQPVRNPDFDKTRPISKPDNYPYELTDAYEQFKDISIKLLNPMLTMFVAANDRNGLFD